VTLGFWRWLFQNGGAALYLGAVIGAIAASTLLLISLGRIDKLGATLPLNGNWFQSLVLETVLTFILMFVILGSGLDRRAQLALQEWRLG